MCVCAWSSNYYVICSSLIASARYPFLSNTLLSFSHFPNLHGKWKKATTANGTARYWNVFYVLINAAHITWHNKLIFTRNSVQFSVFHDFYTNITICFILQVEVNAITMQNNRIWLIGYILFSFSSSCVVFDSNVSNFKQIGLALATLENRE